MVLPGTGSHSPTFQSRTSPIGCASSSAVSCASGAASRSLRVPRCFTAMSEKARAIRLNASQSVFASHGGGTAWLKECTKACMSVEERSYFSYQVAAGSTTSEKSALLVIRKSMVVIRSSLPPGATSLQTTSRGLTSGGDSSALTAGSVAPSRCFRKYSWPVLRSIRILSRETEPAIAQLADGVVGRSRTIPLGLLDEVMGVPIETGVGGHPSQPGGERIAVCEMTAAEQAPPER